MANRELTTAVLAAITRRTVRPALFFEGEFVSAGVTDYLRLFTGVGTLEWDGKTWTGGRDLLAITPIKESRSLHAIGFAVRLSGLPSDKLSIYLQSMRKNRPGRLWLGFFNQVSYLSLPGSGANEASTADAAVLRITGDIGLLARVDPDDYTPGVESALIGKWNSGVNQRAYALRITTAGWLQLLWSTDGTAGGVLATNSTVAIPGVSGTPIYVLATMDVNDGLGNRVTKFWTSTDYDPATGLGTWTQLGATVTVATPTSIHAGTGGSLFAGSLAGSSGVWPGKLYYAEVRSGYGTDDSVVTKVSRFDPRRFTSTNLTAVMETGETWTVDQSGSPKASIVHLPDELIDDPYQLRRGRFDVAEIARNGDTLTVEAQYEDRLILLERAGGPNGERRYTHEDQQLRSAGDKGFAQVPELQDTQDVWGGEVVVAIPKPIFPSRR